MNDVTLRRWLQIFLIYSDQVCESVLFDSPALLLPTTHWDIDWDVLERNQHTFTAFCRYLAEKVRFTVWQARIEYCD